ncbi:MAG: TIR domain-containing protein [Deltaproteobacteria bacterium]|nr:TIR domain-containing protein [Deltaproteobacteria bacterium]
MPTMPITIFYSYSHKDEVLKEQLDTHLALLQRKGLVKTWHDRRIVAGQDWDATIDSHLDEADIILLLVSADFMASEYCYGKELARAMERQERNEIKVVPIIVRAVDWSDAPFARLQALPKDAVPVMSWKNHDEAWLDVEKGIKNAIQEIQEIKFRDNATTTLTSLRDVLGGELKRLEAVYSANTTPSVFCDGIPTGITDLDYLLGGLRASELLVIAGRPSMGKSDIVLRLTIKAAVERGLAVAFYSMQNPVQKIVQRMVAAVSDVNSNHMWRGYLGEKDFPKMALAFGKLMEAPIYIDDSPRITVTDIVERAKSLRDEKQIQLVIIDSLQQLLFTDSNTASQSILALKLLARDLRVPVVVTCSVSPRTDQRKNKRPILADLQENGSLEQEADVVLFLYRDEVYHPGSIYSGVLEIDVAKNRNGPTGLVITQYQPETSSFLEMSETNED